MGGGLCQLYRRSIYIKKTGLKISKEADALAAKSKKRRLDGEGGACWGEDLITREVAREDFLNDQEKKKKANSSRKNSLLLLAYP